MSAAKCLVLGERCSGTNYVERLIEKNFGLQLEQRYWKHGFAQPDGELVFGVVRNPYDWVRSLHAQPHQADAALRNLPLGEFMRTEWRSVWDKWVTDHAELWDMEMFDEHFPNALALRAAKLRHLLSLDSVCILRYEEVESDLVSAIARIAKHLGVEAPSVITPIETYKGRGAEYTIAHYPEFSEAEFAWLNNNIDWDLEAKFDYTAARSRHLVSPRASLPLLCRRACFDRLEALRCTGHLQEAERLAAETALGTGTIGVILTSYRRDYFDRQLPALLGQTVKPSAIYCWQNGDAITMERWRVHGVSLVKCDRNFKFFGRFALGLLVECEWLLIIDDDIVPGPRWLESCLELAKRRHCIVGAKGRRLGPDGLEFVASTGYLEHESQVDFAINAWFLHRDWLHTFWSEHPLMLDNGEDIHLSATLWRRQRIETWLPQQSSAEWSASSEDFGLDEHASSLREPTFHIQRSSIIEHHRLLGYVEMQARRGSFAEEFERFQSLIKRRSPFALARFNDGEAIVLRGTSLDMAYKRESVYEAGRDAALREQLWAALQRQAPNYYVGVPCACCHPNEECSWVRRVSGQPDERLTFANLFVNGNYDRFLQRMMPRFASFPRVYLIAHDGAALGALPFRVTEHLVIGADAWREREPIDRVCKLATEQNGALFLFCAGFLSNLCIAAAHRFNPNNTYLDLGSTLDPILFHEFSRPGYHRINGHRRSQICRWTLEATPKPHCTVNEFLGGLGNQLFQVCTVLSYARDHELRACFPRQSVSLGCVRSPCYAAALGLEIDEADKSDRTVQLIVRAIADPHRFVSLPYPEAEVDAVVFDGQFLNFGYFAHNRQWLRERLFPASERRSNMVLVGLRRFKLERRPDWATDDRFYAEAIARMRLLQPSARYLICSDDLEYARGFVERHLLNTSVELLAASKNPRDGSTELAHFENMLQCEHFILGTSTFHTFAAFLAYTERSTVFWSDTGDWVSQIALPSAWTRITLPKVG